jgi:hypothetical protein
MAFDEQLQHTFESLTARLHQEIDRHLSATSAELSASAQADREAAVAEAVQETRTTAERELMASAQADRDAAVVEAVRETRMVTERELSASAEADRDAAVAEAVRQARADTEHELTGRLADDLARAETQARDAVAQAEAQTRAELLASQKATSERLIGAIRTIDGAKSLTDVLDALVATTCSEVGRAAMFLLQESTLKSWRLSGFEEFGAVASQIELPVADAGLIAEAVETGRVVRLEAGSPRSGVLPAFVNLPERSQALAVPLVMSGQACAVLYADEGNHEPKARESWPSTIEVLARHAARPLEAITASRLAQVEEVASH